jgi:thymidylate kinase
LFGVPASGNGMSMHDSIDNMTRPKLIVLRGPAGSGKSTTAKILLNNATRKTCLIEQDYYRFIFRPYANGSKANSIAIHSMIKNNVLIALNDGYDVILEGILNAGSYKRMLQEIFIEHPTENYIFYFDISFEETMRRHRTRPVKDTPSFTDDDMKSWYPAAYVPIHNNEKLISETSSIEETIKFIRESSNF